MKPRLLTILFAFAMLGASSVGNADSPADVGAAGAQAAATIGDEGVDEIDLEDDAAAAARHPSVKGNMDSGEMSLVDIECDEATLADILRQFRKTTGANIISDDATNLQKRVSATLHNVPWLQGLTSILGSRGFRIETRDNIYRVVEDTQLIPVSTRTFTLNHASAKELTDLFNQLMVLPNVMALLALSGIVAVAAKKKKDAKK